jgi:hypothetical protein
MNAAYVHSVYISSRTQAQKGQHVLNMTNEELTQIKTEGYVTRRQLADILNVSPRLITRLMRASQIPHIRLSHRKHLYEVEAVRRAIAKHEVPSRNVSE